MLKKSLFIAAALFLCCMTTKAVPAYPAKRIITKADGTKIEVTLKGDEHFHYYISDSGERFMETERGKFRTITAEEVKEHWTLEAEKHNARRAKRRIGTERDVDYIGKKKGLVILVEFKDQGFSMDDPQAVFKDFFNKKGYTDYGMTGSVQDYFYDQSYGKLEIDFDVVGPVKLLYNEEFYGTNRDGVAGRDQHASEMVKEACKGVLDQVNLADYDWNGNNEVNQVFIVYAGYGENYGADPTTIWPHESALQYYDVNIEQNGVKINTYACGCELAGTTGTFLEGIGTACHEFTHCLGLPDFYDTGGNNYGMGSWDVMCSGSYNNSSRTPAGYTSYERMFAGWLTPVEINSMQRIEKMKALEDDPTAYILYNDNLNTEYYLLENRQPVKWDKGLSGHGLLVVHADIDKGAWESNTVNSMAEHQRMMIIAADNTYSGYNEAADPFPGTKGITELTNYTTPAAKLYNKNTDGTLFMNKPLDNIKESEEGLISFVACRPEMEIPEISSDVKTKDNSFTISWNAVSDAVEYEIELTEIPAAKHSLEECLMLEENFSKFYSKSTGFTDVSNKIANYMNSGGGWAGSKLYQSPYYLKIGTSKEAGYIITPTANTPESGEITVVIGVQLLEGSSVVKGAYHFITTNGTENIPFEITQNGKIVLHLNTRDDLFRFGFYPNSSIYMNYLAIYEGTFTEEELGVNAEAKSVKRRVETRTLKTSNTYYTFENVDITSTFAYRIRAIGEEVSSQWSQEEKFSFSSTGINNILRDEEDTHAPFYTLDGMKMGNNASTLPKGIYVRNGKKFIVR